MNAAAENTARLLGHPSSTPVTAVMVPKARMITRISPGAGVLNVQLIDLYTRMLAAGVGASGVVLYTAVHKAMLDAFAASVATPQNPAALAEQMHDAVADPNRKGIP
ncbi:class 3 adenylate cyclase [Pseudarthrobacter sp. SLBN-100]|uniref:hypothetical protein n=1 Tax=Arthrobacter sp. SLBN-100 TaxID=2768450 RepID=UPI001151F053|nr:hypothetical protein [Arthrobacter sp. SLBN-100]